MARKLTRIDSTAISVEGGAKRVARGGPNATALVSGVRGSAIRLPNDVSRDSENVLIGTRDRAPNLGMYRGLIIRVVMDAFDNVNFPSFRPVRPIGPECTVTTLFFRWSSYGDFQGHSRPRPTSGGHMNRIHDDKSPIELKLGRDTHTLAYIVHLGCGLHSHDGIAPAVHLQKPTRPLHGCLNKPGAHENYLMESLTALASST